MNTLAFGLGSFTTGDMIIILVIALLLFGRRLPEVGRSLGRGIVEFKKGLRGIEDEIDTQSKPKAQIPDERNEYRQNLPQGDDRRVSRAEEPARVEQPPRAVSES